ncbi:hypothetical protein V6N13_038820 [Hibiscus sabdariffa]|uniref:Uncharacterized protein n=1 Tax=Hibiscus sabdariffa TaxID=183260 RepID=A0ABR2P3N8_9ROSI
MAALYSSRRTPSFFFLPFPCPSAAARVPIPTNQRQVVRFLVAVHGDGGYTDARNLSSDAKKVVVTPLMNHIATPSSFLDVHGDKVMGGE